MSYLVLSNESLCRYVKFRPKKISFILPPPPLPSMQLKAAKHDKVDGLSANDEIRDWNSIVKSLLGKMLSRRPALLGTGNMLST